MVWVSCAWLLHISDLITLMSTSTSADPTPQIFIYDVMNNKDSSAPEPASWDWNKYVVIISSGRDRQVTGRHWNFYHKKKSGSDYLKLCIFFHVAPSVFLLILQYFYLPHWLVVEQSALRSEVVFDLQKKWLHFCFYQVFLCNLIINTFRVSYSVISDSPA